MKKTIATAASEYRTGSPQTYTATVGITIYANSYEEAEAVLDDMSMHDDCKYLNVHDIEDDEGEV